MASRIDPSLAQLFAQNVGAKPLGAPAPRPAAPRLEPALVQKIADNVDMFAHLAVPQVQQVLAQGSMQRHAAGARVFAEGDLGQVCHVVLRGQVQVLKRQGAGQHPVATLGVGDCFGEMALVNDETRTATVLAVGDCVTLRLDRAAIDADPTTAATVYRNIAAILAHRLQAQMAQQAGADQARPPTKEPDAP